MLINKIAEDMMMETEYSILINKIAKNTIDGRERDERK